MGIGTRFGLVRCEYGWVDIYSKVDRERVGGAYRSGEGSVLFLPVLGTIPPKPDVFASSTGTAIDTHFCIEPHGATQRIPSYLTIIQSRSE